MAEFVGQLVPLALVARAIKGKPGMAIKKPCAAVPAPAVVALPVEWSGWNINYPYAGPLVAQLLLARGEVVSFGAGGVCNVGGRIIIGAAGKVFVFASPASLEMWASITRARAFREVELSAGMAPESRAVWLEKKRAALEKAARNRINAAARQTDADIARALVEDADFALAKWAHW